MTQCSQPDGYVAQGGDCNDNDPDLYPGAQSFGFTGNPGFIDTVVSPISGAPTDTYTFEVEYFDVNNEMPPFGFPRAIVDFNSDNNFTGPNDRTVILSPLDPNDTDLTDGKTYVGSITPLEAHLNYQVIVQSVTQGCETTFGPFDAPDVLSQPDLEIFASDISFSEDNPEVNSPLTVTAEVHNASDLPAEDFFVGLNNQFDNTVYTDVFVDFIAPNSSTTVEWTITTPEVDAFVPMQVIVDKTDVIAESNELDNTAVRPFINGDFNVPGSIDVVASVSPTSGFTYTKFKISGSANYSDLAVELDDPSVMGAEVSIFIPELGQTFTSNTNNTGSFTINIPNGNYIAPGVYNYEGSVTDFTLQSEVFTGQFTVSPGPLDYSAQVKFIPNKILDDGVSSSTVIITIKNTSAEDAMASSNLSISQSPGFTSIPANVTIPPLLAGESEVISFSDLVFNSVGVYSVSVQADSNNVLVESNEFNNYSTGTIEVLEPKPDLTFFRGPSGNLLFCQNSGSDLGFSIRNIGNVPSTNDFTVEIQAFKDGSLLNTYTEIVTGDIPVNSTGSVSIPNVYNGPGSYSFTMNIDTLDEVNELFEDNNTGSSSKNVTECRPELSVALCHNELLVSPIDPLDGANVTYKARILNNGPIATSGNFEVLFQVDGPGGVTNYPQVFSGTIGANSSVIISAVAPLAPQGSTLKVTADSNDDIIENNENDNMSSSVDLCHEFRLTPPNAASGNQFWRDNTFFQFESVVPNVVLRASHAYTASEVDVKFEVSGPGIPGTIDLGTVTLDDINDCDEPVGGYKVNLPTSFSFNNLGTYTFTFTVDPDNEYLECDDTNNVLTRDVEVESLADMRTLSEFINPSILNPDVNEPVTLDITYENIGFQNVSDVMNFKVFVNEVEISTINNVPGLLSGDNNTVTVPVPFQSNIVGANVVKIFIDSDDDIVELDETNNEATRVIIVGDASNLFFEDLLAQNTGGNQVQLEAIVGNDGVLDTEAELRFTYITPQGAEFLIGQMPIQLSAGSSNSFFMNWAAISPQATVKAEIINSTVPEFNELDNTITLENKADFNLENPVPLNLFATGGDNVNLNVDVNAEFTTIPFAVNNVQLSAYLSSDCELDVNTDQLLGSTSVDFAIDQSSLTSSINVNLPATVNNNSRIIWVVDNNEQFEESDEDNNELCITVNSDNTVPPVVMTQDIVVQLDANGSVSITPDDIDNGSSDDVTPIIDLIKSIDISTFDCGDLGDNAVTLSVTDANGNTSSGVAIVTVEDNMDPLTSAQDITVFLNSIGEATIIASDIDDGSSDNCSIVSRELDITSFDCNNLGSNTVTLTVTDSSGNTSSTTAIVTVEDDIDPSAVAQDISVTLGAGNTVTVMASQLNGDSTDNCDIASFSIDQTIFDSSDIGDNTVTLTVTDSSGNTDTDTAIVTVEPQDSTGITVVTQDITVQLGASGIAIITPDEVDNGSTTCCTTTLSLDITEFDCGDIGQNTVTLTVADGNGNSSSGTATVTVEDNLAPNVITSDITIQLDANGEGSITPMMIENDTTDNCGVESFSLDITDFDCDDIGANTVTLTVVDVNGNSNSATAIVTVEDNIAPTVITQDITVQLDGTGNASITPAMIDDGSFDNCSIASYSLDVTDFITSNIGPNTVTLTVTDVNGNSSTGTAVVTVQDETNDLPVAIAQDITVQLDTNGEVSITPAMVDNGSTADAGLGSLTLDITEFDCSDLGANTVTLTVTDIDNNSDSATATVNVEDNIAPVAVAQDLTIQLDTNGEASITAAMVDDGSTDNCGIASTELDVFSFDCSNIGDNTVTLTVTDTSGNTSSMTADVSVEDSIAPTVITQDITVELDGFGNAMITPAMIDDGSFDNCSILSISLDQMTFDMTDLGTNTVTLTVTDPSGNSASGTAEVTVEENDGTPNTLAFQEVFTGRGVVSGSVAFDDVDGDNDQDLVLTGALRISATGIAGPLFSDLFKNDGNGTFTQVPGGTSFMGLAYSSASFKDLNNDNILDLISTGENISTGDNFDNFYINNGSGVFSEIPGFAFTNLERKDFKFADFDADGNDDLLIIGQDNNGIPRVSLFQSQGSSFSPRPNNLPKVLFGSIAVADVNGDNLSDIFISGKLLNGNKIAEIYINNGNFQFSLLQTVSFDGLDNGDSSFADVDNDGDQDLLISGQNSTMDNSLKLYLNDGMGGFTEAVGIINLSSNILMQAFDFADVDGDGDSDILMTGYNTNNFTPVTKIWENLFLSPIVPRSDDDSSSGFSVNFIESNLIFGADLSLFPNPVDSGYFDIHSPSLEGEVSIVMSDAQGRIVLSQNNFARDNHVRVYTKDILGGLYIVTIKKGSESYFTKVIVK